MTMRGKKRFDGYLLAGAALAFLLALAAALAPWMAPKPPNETHLAMRLAPPGEGRILGADDLGRDVASRLLHGARVSLAVGFSVAFLAALVGAALGAWAGYAGGATDALLMRLTDVVMAFPGILLVIALAAVLGPSVSNTILILTATGWTGFARLMRAEVLRLKEYEFCEAARALGASPARVLFRHVVPNALSPLLVQAAFAVAGAVMAESALSFLGLGVPPPAPSWGEMLSSARETMALAPHLMVFPTLAVASAVAAFTLLGEGLRRTLDPKSAARG